MYAAQIIFFVKGNCALLATAEETADLWDKINYIWDIYSWIYCGGSACIFDWKRLKNFEAFKPKIIESQRGVSKYRHLYNTHWPGVINGNWPRLRRRRSRKAAIADLYIVSNRKGGKENLYSFHFIFLVIWRSCVFRRYRQRCKILRSYKRWQNDHRPEQLSLRDRYESSRKFNLTPGKLRTIVSVCFIAPALPLAHISLKRKPWHATHFVPVDFVYIVWCVRFQASIIIILSSLRKCSDVSVVQWYNDDASPDSEIDLAAERWEKVENHRFSIGVGNTPQTQQQHLGYSKLPLNTFKLKLAWAYKD